MPEKITIVKESGESVTSNIMSIFMVPENNKQYIITTENAVDPHGLTVLHVSEIKGNKIVKVQTDDEWATIKTIMRSIISGSVGSFKYIPIISDVNAADQYSRDISVSAGAAKTLLESYTNGKKEVAITDDTTPVIDPNAISSDSIFPTAPVDTDKDSEIVPGISVVDEQVNIEPAVSIETESTSDSTAGATDNTSDDASTPVIPIVNNMAETEEEDPDSAGGNVLAINTEAVNQEPATEDPTNESSAVTPVIDPAIAPVVPTPEIPSVPEIPAMPDVPEISINENDNPQGDTTSDVSNASDSPEVNSSDQVENTKSETASVDPIPSENSDVSTEETNPVVEDIQPMEETNPIAEDIQPAEETNDIPAVDIPTSQTASVPEGTSAKEEKIITANLDADTVKEALGDIVNNKISEIINEKADELLPSAVENSVSKAMDTAITGIQAPLEQKVEEAVSQAVEEKIQTTLKKAVEDTVAETMERQSKALKSLGIKLDFGVESSFGKNASLDEIVAGAQELFVEGVKNLIMVMTERVYKELRIKEEELKKREIIVSQREQAVNDKTIAMMNGTFDPANYSSPSVVPTVAEQPSIVPPAPVTPEVPAAPTSPAAPEPAVPEKQVTPEPTAPVAPVSPEPAAQSTVTQESTPIPEAVPAPTDAVPQEESVVPEVPTSDVSNQTPAENQPAIEPVAIPDTPPVIETEAPVADTPADNTPSLAVAEAVPAVPIETTTEQPAENPQTQ